MDNEKATSLKESVSPIIDKLLSQMNDNETESWIDSLLTQQDSNDSFMDII